MAERAGRVVRREALFSPSATKAVYFSEAISLYWARHQSTVSNFGDALSPILARYLLHKPVVHASDVLAFGPWKTLYLIGSILDNMSKPNGVVFGAGFKSAAGRMYRKPSKVLCVRGPLTREKLIRARVACPEVYCDPGLLLPELIRPEIVERKWNVGLVPHFVDKPHAAQIRVEQSGLSYRTIDIEGDIRQVVDDISACEVILSSSLHGIVTAHALGIPAVWVMFSDQVGGEGFKFRDYFASLGMPQPRPHRIAGRLALQEVAARATSPSVRQNVDALKGQLPQLLDVML